MDERRPFYYHETQGIRITVRSVYLENQSVPVLRRFVFTYFIRIENVGPRSVQLLSRHWYIHDSAGEDSEVAGEGVVGEQPQIVPGGVHEYNSFCILKSPSGHMEGSYHFAYPDDTRFDAIVPRFLLVAAEAL